MRPSNQKDIVCKARVHLIDVAIAHDVKVTLSQDATRGEWVVSALHARGEHWTATSSDILDAAIQLERLLICSQRI